MYSRSSANFRGYTIPSCFTLVRDPQMVYSVQCTAPSNSMSVQYVSLQLTAHSSQLTAQSSQLTAHRKVEGDIPLSLMTTIYG